MACLKKCRSIWSPLFFKQMTRHRNTENCCFTSQGAGGCPRITCKKVWLFRMPSFVLKKGMKQQKNFKLGCDFSPIHSDLWFFRQSRIGERGAAAPVIGQIGPLGFHQLKPTALVIFSLTSPWVGSMESLTRKPFP